MKTWRSTNATWKTADILSNIISMRTSCFIVWLISIDVVCSTPLPSSFYQPGPGVYFERWVTTTFYSMTKFSDIPLYPDCPNFISQSENFEYAVSYSGKRQYGRFRASFVPQKTGKHKFFAILYLMAKIYIDVNPNGPQKIGDFSSGTADNWNQKKWCNEVDLIKGFRYELTVYYYGDGSSANFFRLGVKLPDNTEVKPITKAYLRRSVEYYNWKGLIAHKYDNFQFPSNQEDYTLAKAYSMNPSYPNSPSSFICKSTLYEPAVMQFDYYALRYIGYLTVPANAQYMFTMFCNEICQVFLTKSGTETNLGHYNDAWRYSGKYSTEMNPGALSKNTMYPIKIFFTESWGYDFLQIQYKIGSGGYQNSWTGMLHSLLPAEVAKSTPIPIATMVNSTAISVQLPSAPFLPPKDQWIYVQNHDLLFHRKGVEETPQKITVNEALPKTVIATGLKKYTEYVFYAHYFGTINSVDQNIITTYSAAVRTDEDVPDTGPPNFAAQKRSSTSIRVTWNIFSDNSLWNGIGIGYEVQYKLKSASGSWTSALLNGIGNRQYLAGDLLKYRVYEFKVAARTSKGSGAFSSIVEERTMEDVPSAGPSNITAQNTSSSSIIVTWDDVLEEHRNGIIIGYKVFLKKVGSEGGWQTEEMSQKTFSKSGLDLWAFYDIKISAKTSVGEGTQSSVVRVRTDEDVPGAPPLGIVAAPDSSKSLNITWSDIRADQRYGIILSYNVKYKRTDGKGVEKELIAYAQSTLLLGLAESVEYDIAVAGMTSKGIGVYSPKISVATGEDVPDAPPTNLRGNYTNSTAIRVHWDLVPKANRNGIIRRYPLQYKIKDSPSEWKEIIVEAIYLTLEIAGLEYYTIYQVRVAAETSIGRGPYTNLTYIRTEAHAPSKPPMNLTGHFMDHISIEMKWTRVPKEHRQGIIEGYKLYYKDKTIPDGPWHNVIVPNRQGGSDLFNKTVTGLRIYTPYVFRIQAFTYKADGVFSENITVWTDEYDPKEAPKNISGLNASSTEIILKWKDMREIDGEANGKVLGYIIKYRVVDCHEDRPEGCDEKQVFNITSNGSLAEIKIPNLRKYTKYSMSVQVFNSKGKGNFSKIINITTDEDKPDESPTLVETWPSKSDSIEIYWSPIPESHRNGIILGYRIFYKPIVVPQRRYDRAPRSVNEFAIYGALPGEKMTEVNSSTYSVGIDDLKDYSWYQVRVGAFTSKGLGVTFTINGTTKQQSPVEAPKLYVTDMYAFEEILLNWEPISKAGARGEVLGYRIQYWLSELHENPVVQDKKYHFDVQEPNRTTIVKRLEPFARYRIRILAITEGGFGVWSREQDGDTCRCSKTLSSAKIILPPLVKLHNLDVLPALLDEAVTSCCGNCSGRHGITRVNWERDSKNLSSVKHSKNEALDAIAAGTNLALPIFRDSFEIEGDVDRSEYVMVPLLEANYLAIFRRVPTKRELGNAASSIVANSIWEQYPLLLISTVLAVLAGILFWTFERSENVEEFSGSVVKGSGSGLWLAYITMTTVGYGDLTPITKLGKILAMIWMLIGLVLTSMVIGNMSSIFSVEFIFEPPSFDATGKVLTSEDTLMLATQLYGGNLRIGNTSNGPYIQQSLLSGNISKVVLDIYTASVLKDYLLHPNIMLEKLERIEAGYGVALTGETRRIKTCISRFAKENAKSAMEKIAEETYLYQLGTARSTDLTKHIGSPNSDMMEHITFYSGIVLGILAGLGIIYELWRCFRDRAKVDTDTDFLKRLSEDILEDINNLESNVSANIEKIEHTHAKERLLLSKMKHGRYVKLVSMYPNLNLFDPELPKMKKHEVEHSKSNAENKMRQKYYVSDDEDDDDIEWPMDYKTDSRF